MSASSDTTTARLGQTLSLVAAGDRRAADELLPLVYDELRNYARARLAREPAGTTLQPTALVHEAYLRLVAGGDPGWDGRPHFFGAAARAMRNILVDRARRRNAIRHGGQRQRSEWEEVELAIEAPSVDMVALDEALTELEREDPRRAHIVMLHYFGGLNLDEVAVAVGLSERTVQREWRFARSLLFMRLGGEKSAQD